MGQGRHAPGAQAHARGAQGGEGRERSHWGQASCAQGVVGHIEGMQGVAVEGSSQGASAIGTQHVEAEVQGSEVRGVPESLSQGNGAALTQAHAVQG